MGISSAHLSRGPASSQLHPQSPGPPCLDLFMARPVWGARVEWGAPPQGVWPLPGRRQGCPRGGGTGRAGAMTRSRAPINSGCCGRSAPGTSEHLDPDPAALPACLRRLRPRPGPPNTPEPPFWSQGSAPGSPTLRPVAPRCAPRRPSAPRSTPFRPTAPRCAPFSTSPHFTPSAPRLKSHFSTAPPLRPSASQRAPMRPTPPHCAPLRPISPTASPPPCRPLCARPVRPDVRPPLRSAARRWRGRCPAPPPCCSPPCCWPLPCPPPRVSGRR